MQRKRPSSQNMNNHEQNVGRNGDWEDHSDLVSDGNEGQAIE